MNLMYHVVKSYVLIANFRSVDQCNAFLNRTGLSIDPSIEVRKVPNSPERNEWVATEYRYSVEYSRN